MPIRCSDGRRPRFRVRRLSGGRRQRLAFCGNKVVEAKMIGGGRRRRGR